jgi:hypothetical protein
MSQLALPTKLRETAVYRATADMAFRFLIEQVGDVRGIYEPTDPIARQFVYRYATGFSVEVACMLFIIVSPVWVLAALGDATRAGKHLYIQIGDALKAEGLVDPGAQFETMEQLMDGLEKTCSHLALTINMPPLNPKDLRQEWRQFRENLASLPPAQLPTNSEVEQTWKDIQSAAGKAHRSVFSVSAALGMSAGTAIPSRFQLLSRSAKVAARTTGTVVGGLFLDHYSAASKEIAKEGFDSYFGKHSRPYLVAAVRNFLPERKTWIERTLS